MVSGGEEGGQVLPIINDGGVSVDEVEVRFLETSGQHSYLPLLGFVLSLAKTNPRPVGAAGLLATCASGANSQGSFSLLYHKPPY